jgi:TetR/AcrR family transcriptional regulator, regulator of cefoperazone and chloramphenicol sensitivity
MKISKSRAPRSDGEESRERLLYSALRLFAEKGFTKTSTRDIAQAAGVNIAGISYYFGDKAGLYRAAFIEPMGAPQDDIALFNGKDLTLEQALSGLFHGFTEPMKQDELMRLCTRLHMREMVEPTGMWEHEIDNGIVPHHAALTLVLARHLGVKQVDDDIHRLAQSIVAMGVFLFVGRDVMEKIAPQLTASHEAIDLLHERLVMYAHGMVQAEDSRRSASATNQSRLKPPAQRGLPRTATTLSPKRLKA